MEDGKIINDFTNIDGLCCYNMKEDFNAYDKIHYLILSSFYVDNLQTSGSSSGAIEAYCRINREIPKTIDELLNFCFLSDYHPNDMVVDDFKKDQLRFIEKDDEYLLYFIGPDGKDDKCELRIYPEQAKDVSLEFYLGLKGDFVLGGVDMEIVNHYTDKSKVRR